MTVKHICTKCTEELGYSREEREIDDWGICPKCGHQGVIYTVPEYPSTVPVLSTRATVQFGESSNKKSRKKSK